MSDIDAQIVELLPQWYADPLRFVKEAFPWGHGELEGETGPDVWQAEFLTDLGNEVKRAEKEKGSIRMAVASGHGVGKTAVTCWIIIWFLTVRNPAKVRVTANTEAQLLGTDWAELSLWHNRLVHKHWFNWTATAFYRVDNERNARAEAVTWNENKAAAFAGVHSKNTLLLMDEASGIPQTIWETAIGYLTTEQAIHLAFGNPTEPSGGFYDCFHRLKHRWITRHVDSRTAKKADRKLLDEIVNDYGEDSDLVRRRVRGLFPRQGARQFISRDVVEEAMTRRIPAEEIEQYGLIMGVDVARYGDDRSCIVLRKGPKVLSIETFEQTNLADFADHVVSTLKRNPEIVACYVDEAGLGAGVVDMAMRYDDRVMGVNVGRRAKRPDIYMNLRIELWAKGKKWLETASLPDNQQLLQELCTPEYVTGAGGKTQLERKEHMKARGLASPDIADSLMLTFAGPDGIDLDLRGEDEDFDYRMREATGAGRSAVTGY
jgi:hypothetical protein